MSSIVDSSDPGVRQAAAEAERFRRDVGRLRAEVQKAIVGHEAIVDGVIAALLSGGHVLLEGVPGIGKTLFVRTLAEALDLPFSRIQFTPDLMPADIVGTNVIVEDERGHRGFEFVRGPIFASIVLADEINRATPKTQSALLQAMQEAAVTVARETMPLPQPFFVLATQNPLEMEGTYALPEAQLDRFFVKLKLSFPSGEALHAIMDRTTSGERPRIERVVGAARLLELRAIAEQVPVPRSVQEHAIALLLATHPGSASAPEPVRRYVRYGASPRGAQAMLRGAKVRALLAGRYSIAVEDVRAMAAPALRHRMILNFEGEAEAVDADALVTAILDRIA